MQNGRERRFRPTACYRVSPISIFAEPDDSETPLLPMKEQLLARDLALFSIALGLAELLAPRKVAELIGLRSGEHEILIRLLGVREITNGLGIMQGSPKLFLWSRVAGDMIDLGLLTAAMSDERNDREKLQVAFMSVAAVTVCDVLGSVMHSREHTEPGWRIRDPGSYEGGMSQESPEARRANTDQAMSQFQSGHVDRGEDNSGPGATPQSFVATTP